MKPASQHQPFGVGEDRSARIATTAGGYLAHDRVPSTGPPGVGGDRNPGITTSETGLHLQHRPSGVGEDPNIDISNGNPNGASTGSPESVRIATWRSPSCAAWEHRITRVTNPPLWAHSVNPGGDRHLLSDHLHGTGTLAETFGSVFNAGPLCRFLGVTHDTGKGFCDWQAGLLRAETAKTKVVDEFGDSIDHKLAGTWLAYRKAKLGVYAMAVLGHHGGLSDTQTLAAKVAEAEDQARERVEAAVAAVSAVVPELLPANPVALPAWVKKGCDPFAAELLLRLSFSALVDSDYLDTSSHFDPEQTWALGPSLASMVNEFEQARADYLTQFKCGTRPAGSGEDHNKPSPVDKVRAHVYDQSVQAAQQPRGLFVLPAPTGSGKTIAVGGFAAHHAAAHGHQRVIIAVPYMSITSQNADVYRQLYGAANVLEHHSGAELTGTAKRAAENWDAPVVVTTTVQLFQSLFARKPGAMRKLHRLANAVIVLDEVQALPDQMLLPILSALRHLTEYMGTTVLLASATQPSFFDLDVWKDLQPTSVIANPQPIYDKLSRVTYRWWPGTPTLQEVAERAVTHDQVIVISNTTSDAAIIHDHMTAARTQPGPVLHLSTRMAAAHRAAALDHMRRLLDAKQPLAVSATQLVEAGVDVDFPAGYRAHAPADSLQQAAGRINRNGHLDAAELTVFRAADADPAGERLIYGAALAASRQYIGSRKADPDNLQALDAYYRMRYALKNLELVSAGAEVQQHRADFDFVKTSELFRMIDDITVPVLIPAEALPAASSPFVWGNQSEYEFLLMKLGEPEPARWVLRRLQPYLAALPRSQAERAVGVGYAEIVGGDLYMWRGPYDPLKGLTVPPTGG